MFALSASSIARWRHVGLAGLLGLLLAPSVGAEHTHHFPVRSANAWTVENAQLRSPFWNRHILPASQHPIGFSRYPRPNPRTSWYSNRPNNGWGGTGYHPAPWHAGQSEGGWILTR